MQVHKDIENSYHIVVLEFKKWKQAESWQMTF